MPFDMAQLMVDLTQTALVLVQAEDTEDEEEAEDTVPAPGEVSLLVPQFFPANGECLVATRCLINGRAC